MQFEEFANEYFGEKEKTFERFADEKLGGNGKGFEGFASGFLEAQKIPKRFEDVPPPAGYKELGEGLKAEIAPPEVERKVKQRFAIAHDASKLLQSGKKHIYVAHKFLDTATLGLINKLVDRSEFESMPKDVATVVAGELAHFAGFLAGPVKLAKIPVKAFSKALGKVVKNPKVLNWLRYGTEHVGTLALASPISDVTDIQSFKDFAEKAGSGAALGAVFAGTGLANFMKSPTLNRIIRQVGSRAVGNIFKVYSPDVVRWKEMSDEERAKAVFDEILFSYFSWRGVKPSAISRQKIEAEIRRESEGRRPEETVLEAPIPERPIEKEPIPPIPKEALLEQAREAHEKGTPRKELPEEVLKAVEAEENKASLKRILKEIEAKEKGEAVIGPSEKALEEVISKRPVEPELPFKPAELEPERPPTAKPIVEEAKIPAIEKEPVKKPYVEFKQKTNEELESMVKYGAQKEKAQAELDRRYLGELEPEKVEKPTKKEIEEEGFPDFVFEEEAPVKPVEIKEPISRQEIIKKATAKKPIEPVVKPDALLKQTEAYLLEKGVPRENWGPIIERVKKTYDPSRKEPLENFLAKTAKYFEEGEPRGRGQRERPLFEGAEVTAKRTAWGKKEQTPEEIYIEKEAVEQRKGLAVAMKAAEKKLSPDLRAIASSIRKGESPTDAAKRLKISRQAFYDRQDKMREALAKDPKLKEYAEENLKAAEKAKDGKSIPILRKYAGLDPGSIELRRLPAPVQDLVNLMSETYKGGRELAGDAIRLPQWDARYEALTKKLIDSCESEPNRVVFKGFRMAWALLKEKNKEKYYRAIEAEEELGARLTSADLKEIGLSDQQVKNFKGTIRAFDFVHKYKVMLMRKAGVPENKAEAEKIGWKGTTIEDFKKEKNPAFWPHRRYGRYAVFLRAREDVIGRKGPRIEYRAFEKERLALDHIDTLKEQGRKNTVVEDGVKYALFKRGTRNYKVPMAELENLKYFDTSKYFKDTGSFFEVMRHLPILEQIFKKKGIEFAGMTELTRILGKEALTKFAGGAFARRADVPGWSKDYGRAIEEYFSSVPPALAKRYYRADIEEIRKSIPSENQTYAEKQIKYFMGEEKWENNLNQGVRRFIYDFFLGFKLSFGGLNLTQPLQTTVPMAQAKGGARGVLSVIKAKGKETRLFIDYAKSGFKDLKTTIRNAKFLSVAEKRTLTRMYEAGELGAARIRDITGIEIKKEPRKAITRRIEQAAQIIGFATERSNRLHAALTDVDISMNKGLRNINLITDSARDLTGKTQWLYSKATRMKVARGTLAPLFVFKSFINNYFRMQGYLFRNNKPAFVTANAIMIGLAGGMGFPAYIVLRNLTLSGLRAAGIISDDEELMKQAHDIEESIKESGWIGEAMISGLPSMMGVEGPWVFGAGELLDFAPESILNSWKYMIKDLLGPKRKNLDTLESFARISPTALAHLIRWYQLVAQKKMPSGVTGKPKLTEQDLKTIPASLKKYARALYDDLPTAEDISAGEKALYATGFPTKKIARYGTEVYYIKRLAAKVRTKKAAAHEFVAKAIAGLNISSKRTKTANVAWLRINFNKLLGMMDEDTRKEIKEIISKYEKDNNPLSHQAILNQLKKHVEGKHE